MAQKQGHLQSQPEDPEDLIAKLGAGVGQADMRFARVEVVLGVDVRHKEVIAVEVEDLGGGEIARGTWELRNLTVFSRGHLVPA